MRTHSGEGVFVKAELSDFVPEGLNDGSLAVCCLGRIKKERPVPAGRYEMVRSIIFRKCIFIAKRSRALVIGR